MGGFEKGTGEEKSYHSALSFIERKETHTRHSGERGNLQMSDFSKECLRL